MFSIINFVLFVSFVVILDFSCLAAACRARLKVLYHLHTVLSNQLVYFPTCVNPRTD